MDFRVHEWSHKKWKYFPNALSNNNIPFIEQDYKNICAIINKFRPSIAVIKVLICIKIKSYNHLITWQNKLEFCTINYDSPVIMQLNQLQLYRQII